MSLDSEGPANFSDAIRMNPLYLQSVLSRVTQITGFQATNSVEKSERVGRDCVEFGPSWTSVVLADWKICGTCKWQWTKLVVVLLLKTRGW